MPKARKAPPAAKAKHKAKEEEEEEKGEELGGENGEEKGDVSAPKSLYSVLGVEKGASQAEIKKAYHRLALQLHPDKNPNDQGAKEKFQSLQNVFSVLGDPEKRRLYDETGCTEDALSGEQFQNLYEYFRTLFGRVTEEDIERFEEQYRGSEEEVKDLKELYQRHKGNMDLVFEWMILSRRSLDSHRFKDALEAAIAAGELKSYKPFKKWAAEVANTPRPKSDPLKQPKKRKKETSTDLVAAIRGRQADRASALDNLALKYGGGSKMQEPDIPDSEFSAIQERMAKRSKGRRK